MKPGCLLRIAEAAGAAAVSLPVSLDYQSTSSRLQFATRRNAGCRTTRNISSSSGPAMSHQDSVIGLGVSHSCIPPARSEMPGPRTGLEGSSDSRRTPRSASAVLKSTSSVSSSS